MTEIISTAEHQAATIPDAVLTTATDIAQDLGAVEQSAEHHTAQLATHAEKIAGVEGDINWIKQELDRRFEQTANLPDQVRAEVTSTLETFKDELLTAVSSTQAAGNGETTNPPEETPNRAKTENKSMFGKIGTFFHRLL